jgi:DNA-binding NarL/FixJ family response regulator
MNDQPVIEVAVLIRDLIFETKIKSTAQSLGIGAVVVRSAQELEALLVKEPSIRLLIVDLNTAGPTACDAIRIAKNRPTVCVLAFVSHVDTDLANLASEAGADEVLPRSRFSAQLPQLLGHRGGGI